MSSEKPIKLAYGKRGLLLNPEWEWNVTVIEPEYHKGLPDEGKAIKHEINHPEGCPPLEDIVKSGMKVGIIFNDITRPTPNKLIIETLITVLSGINEISIILFNALGTHRPNTDAELRSMLGDYLVDNYNIVQNNAFEKSTQIFIGKTSSGNQVWLNKELMSCDIRILTGFIEPHFFAGFSGGGKAIMPGMAGIETIMKNHNSQNIGDLRSSWGITKGNPIWEEVREVLSMTGKNFLLNVTLNRDKKITSVFAGDPFKAHDKGVELVRKTSMVPVSNLFDIVVTTNSGFPLDLNLYQTVKGISAAARILKNGGAIIAAAECWDGIPDHGLFGHLLKSFSHPSELLEEINKPEFAELDQWQAQILAQIQLKGMIYLYSENLSDEQLKMVKIKRCSDIRDQIEMLRIEKGKDASICVIPEGPQTIPYLLPDADNIVTSPESHEKK